jgi:hypothetical protein
MARKSHSYFVGVLSNVTLIEADIIDGAIVCNANFARCRESI